MALAVTASLNSTTIPFADVDPIVNMARQAMYRFAALSFLDPQVGSWDRLNALRVDPLLLGGAALIRSLPEARPLGVGLGESPIEMLDPLLVLERLPNSERALNTQYENTFGLLVSGNGGDVVPDTVTVTLDAPSEAGMYHVLLAGLSGNDPGIALSDWDPADVRFLPVNEDLLVDFQLNDPSFPLTPNFIDLLDANGQHSVTFQVIKGKFFKDKEVSLAFCTLDPNDLSKIRFVAAPIHFDVQ